MKCKNCNKDIEEQEVFCEECKRELRRVSSRRDVSEFEKLVEENKNLNDLEDTKELPTLTNLQTEEIKEEQIENKTIVMEPIKELFNEKEEIIEKKGNKKKIVIIISCIVSLIIIISLILVFTLGKKEEKEEVKPTIDYKKIINEYGTNIENIVESYMNDNTKTPKWKDISELITYNKYKIICEVHEIYKDGSIYLNNCKVDDKKVKYSFGDKKDEKQGKELNIYKLIDNNNYSLYYENQVSGSNLVNTITCETEDCTYISAYDKYVLVKENNEYYLYNYENNSIEFGPFNINSTNDLNQTILSYQNKLYGILYSENNQNHIYNVNNSKTIKNVKGTLEFDQMNYIPFILLKYNYVILKNNNTYNFININTGNISYSIKDNISAFIEDKNNNIVYIKSYNSNNTKFRLYNSNGKLLFNGDYINDFRFVDNEIIITNQNNFKMYDKNLNLKLTSKEYDKIVAIYDKYIVVLKENKLNILDLKENILTEFDDEIKKDNYKLDSMLSGIQDNTINIVMEINGKMIKYNYNISTKESNKIEL